MISILKILTIDNFSIILFHDLYIFIYCVLKNFGYRLIKIVKNFVDL